MGYDWAGTRDPLGRFYTADAVGGSFVNLFDYQNPAEILDLGSGAGSLTVAAAKRWTDAGIVTVDIDAQVSERVRDSLRTVARARHRHLHADVLDEGLPQRLAQRNFDIAVCNPPYLTLPWQDGFGRILAEAGMEPDAGRRPGGVSAEIVFLAQILRVVRERAEIGVIVPDGLVTGRRAANLRRMLLERVRVSSVVQLPRGSFRGTEAQAYVVVLRNEPGRDEDIELSRLGPDGPELPTRVTRHVAETRMDHAFHRSARSAAANAFRLRDVGAEIVRGGLSSSEARRVPHPVFHTSDFRGPPGFKAKLPTDSGLRERPGRCVAGEGDILVARVDRNLHLKVCQVESGQALLTDCVYALRVPRRWRETVLRALGSPAGSAALLRASRGVGARMLSKAEFLEVELELT